MKRVTGIGGVFFKARDPASMNAWYADKLGLNIDPKYGTSFEWRCADAPDKSGHTAWSIFDRDSDYFGRAEQQFMVNYRVADLEALLETLRAEGVEIAKEIESFEYGKFAHIVDPEGNRIELWQPVDEEYAKMVDGDGH